MDFNYIDYKKSRTVKENPGSVKFIRTAAKLADKYSVPVTIEDKNEATSVSFDMPEDTIFVELEQLTTLAHQVSVCTSEGNTYIYLDYFPNKT